MEPAPEAGLVVDHFPAAARSLRVACVTETYPPEVNGVSLTVARMVEGLHARNHDVQLVRPRQEGADTPDRGDRFHEVLLRGMPIPRYPSLRMGMPSKRTLVKLWTLQRPDVVHIATEGPLGWSALQAALHLKLPVCSDFRTNFHSYTQHYGIGWLRKPIMGYLRKFHNRTLCTMVPTEGLRRELRSEGFERLEVVTRGVDTRQFDPARRSAALRASWGADDDTLVVCCVGRLAREKNLDVLIDAFRAIERRVPSSRLVLVGGGPLEQELRSACPGGVFAGQRRGDDLAAHYASADLFLFPSLTETFGNVTTEAMASGLPVVAFDYAAAAQLIDHDAQGVRVPFGDGRAFAEAALALAFDPARRERLGRAARERALLLDWSTIVQRFEGVLTTVIREAAGAQGLPAKAAPGLHA
ncbi:MAG: glycosyltransferase family 4 protein [Piscinibacter sp.]|uniref:glycosyltransferase family 4 protein n=1 Tax=Piscinibacter sp. TaxID=1903157 RepID=UPI003D147862